MKNLEKNVAQAIFKQFCEDYKKRDLEALLNLFTKNTNMWGSGLDEYRVGLKEIEEQFKRDWRQSEKGEVEIVSFIETPPNALWAAAVCKAKLAIDGKELVFDHFRGTIIIEEENNAWKISHMHASFPDYRNPENNSFPING